MTLGTSGRGDHCITSLSHPFVYIMDEKHCYFVFQFAYFKSLVPFFFFFSLGIESKLSNLSKGVYEPLGQRCHSIALELEAGR